MSVQQIEGTLELSREEMQSLGYRVVDTLVEHFDRLRDQSVIGVSSRPALEKALREPLPIQGMAPEDLVRQLQADVFSNMAHVAHPRFFALIPSPSNFVSVMADTLAAGFNANVTSWLTASGPAMIEHVTLDWLRQLCGLPPTAGGLFVSGGSMANLTALAVARHIQLADDIANATIYLSDQTHFSVERGLRVLGFHATQIRKLPSDSAFRLPLAALRDVVRADRAAGKEPFCIVANAGTTNTGAIDPLDDLADFAREQGLWLHADGAYGAAATLSERHAVLLAGLGRVDSLTFDPHKWLFQPYEIGCVLVRDARWLPATFHHLPEYLRDTHRGEEEMNFGFSGIQLSRGFRALKLWMSLKTFGLEAFQDAIDRGFALAEIADKTLRQSPCWEVITPAQMGIVTFRYRPAAAASADCDALNQRIVDAMQTDGFAFLSSTTLRGQTVLRLCTINPRTTDDDIRETIARLAHFGATLSDEQFIMGGASSVSAGAA